MPVLAVIGICLIMFSKRGKKKDLGVILIGFAVLMVGMELMSGSVSGLKNDPSFHSILTMFENPILGIFAGLVLTVIVQSSSASVGILQALTATGGITYGAALPIIMGQNIGTCVTALISSISANRNGKRAAMIHLYFNVIAVVVVLSGFYIVNYFAGLLDMSGVINAWGVAAVHTVFKIIAVATVGLFNRGLVKLAELTVKDSKEEAETANLLDERLLNTPAIAVARATEVA
jgi:phosphate:Na+ symporter